MLSLKSLTPQGLIKTAEAVEEADADEEEFRQKEFPML